MFPLSCREGLGFAKSLTNSSQAESPVPVSCKHIPYVPDREGTHTMYVHDAVICLMAVFQLYRVLSKLDAVSLSRIAAQSQS